MSEQNFALRCLADNLYRLNRDQEMLVRQRDELQAEIARNHGELAELGRAIGEIEAALAGLQPEEG